MTSSGDIEEQEGAPRERCSFCGKFSGPFRIMVAGPFKASRKPNLFICEDCVNICVQVLNSAEENQTTSSKGMEESEKAELPKNLPPRERCSFCGKFSGPSRLMVAGPPTPSRKHGLFICEDCIDTCLHILAKDGISRWINQLIQEGETSP